MRLIHSFNLANINKALRDIYLSLKTFEFWAFLSHHDIKQGYRHSIIGPFWITLTTACMVGGIGFVYGGLFGQSLTDYLPSLAAGLVLWNFMNGTICEGASVFINAGGIIKQTNLPKLSLVFRLIYKNILVFLHNALIIIAVILIFDVDMWSTILYVPFFFALLLVNLGWMVCFSAMLSARYRDIPPIVTSAMQLLFFMTPIIWKIESLPHRLAFVDANPFYHFIELLRGPLLGHMPSSDTIIYCLGTAVLGWALTFMVFVHARSRLIFWI